MIARSDTSASVTNAWATAVVVHEHAERPECKAHGTDAPFPPWLGTLGVGSNVAGGDGQIPWLDRDSSAGSRRRAIDVQGDTVRT